jgi:hypothetical protein
MGRAWRFDFSRISAMSRLLPILVLVLALTAPSRGAEPLQPEQLPPPKNAGPLPVVPPAMVQPLPLRPSGPIMMAHPMGLPPMVYTRRSDYAVWQNLAVDRYGRFRPVVIDSPLQPYYRYNGKAFPWVQQDPKAVMPYVVQ